MKKTVQNQKISSPDIEETITVSKQYLTELRHALRTPLNAIIGYSEMLQEDAEELQATDTVLDLQKILDAAHYLLRLVNESFITEHLIALSEAASMVESGVGSFSAARSSLPKAEVVTEPGFLLVVDDNADNREVLGRHLERQGHNVMMAENGAQALEMLQKQRFDLLLLDIIMPQPDGFEVLQRVKTEQPELPVLMISALNEMESVVRCIEMGAEDFLPKPFNPVLLRARITACLEKKRFRDKEIEYHKTLAETNEQLKIANANYMQMLGFVTHELKAPLSAIQSMISLVMGGFAGEVPEKIGHYLLRIKRNCEELQDMVKNYLDLSRAERGELVANKVAMDFAKEVVVPSVEQTRAIFESRGMTLSVEAPELLSVRADPELLRIALTNYLTNAAKYGAENGQARLTVTEKGDEIEVCVWNEGQGFTAEEHSALFAKFSRLQNKNTADKRGSGLGLFLIKNILEQHQGAVRAESEPGKWARFCLSFPRESA